MRRDSRDADHGQYSRQPDATGKIHLCWSGRIALRRTAMSPKIGTLLRCGLARAHGIPFYVAAPYSTIDLTTKSGADIPHRAEPALESDIDPESSHPGADRCARLQSAFERDAR